MKFFRTSFLSLSLSLVLLLPSVALAQQPTAALQQTSARLAGEVLVNGRAMEYVQNLSDKFGGRLSGSPAYGRAAGWAAEQFRAAGIKDVRLEPFRLESTWTRGVARARMLAPLDRPLHLESLGWAPSTPAAGVRGEVFVLTDISRDFIKREAGKIKGRIVMLDLSSLLKDGYAAFGKLVAAQQLLADAGAAAVIIGSNDPDNVLNAFNLNWGARLSPLPLAQVGMEDAKLIQRLLPQGAVTLEFQYENRTGGAAEDNNVVAEIRGRERPDEWIIIGAHLDSWDYGTGAQDNATGCAMVLEAARAIAALPTPPRRSIRFALWGGEEQGLLGSAAYVRAHASELKDCVAVLNTDNGAGHPRGWKVEGRADVQQALTPLSESLLKGLGGEGVSPELSFDTDHGHFMLAGIPALDLWVDMEHYDDIHHKSSDTVDKVVAHNLVAGASIVAVTAHALAERPERIAPQLKHDAVSELLKKANLEEFLKTVGVWK
ncbi:MAG TPA: M20/M25/M40 family metallo-hydrolase [Pyrinomonadaceae bacterium]|jgi:Iap family predicted aminopeptidase|nr:M20/M25/M40 family metallo-hydrolase [Pyrinomonadaceae bacterium]